MAFLGADFFRGEFFFATCFRQKMFFCAKNIFSSHLAIMATGSANPGFFSLLQTTTSCCKWSRIWLASGYVGCPPGHSSWSLVVLSVHKWLLIRYWIWNNFCWWPVFAIVKLRMKKTQWNFREILIEWVPGRGGGVWDFNLSNAIWCRWQENWSRRFMLHIP